MMINDDPHFPTGGLCIQQIFHASQSLLNLIPDRNTDGSICVSSQEKEPHIEAGPKPMTCVGSVPSPRQRVVGPRELCDVLQPLA